jgi:hypothetical protein
MRIAGCCAVLLLVSVQFGCNVCSDEAVSNTSSPDAVLVATSFVRNCGATTDFSSMVSVHRKDTGFKEEREIVFVAKGRHDLLVSWTGPKTLSIRCTSCGRKDVFRQVVALGSVDVAFDIGSSSLKDK